jgi:transcriptional regulator with XRE-family HTH domain
MIGGMDWPNIIQDLIDSGMTQSEIAESCDTGQSHVSALLRGDRKNPNWPLGQRILDLHTMRTRKPSPSEQEAA